MFNKKWVVKDQKKKRAKQGDYLQFRLFFTPTSL